MKDGTQQGIREVGRNDREKESQREANTPSFVASSSLSFFPQATNFCLSLELGRQKWSKGEKKKGGEAARWG